jgi:hypothetical protein
MSYGRDRSPLGDQESNLCNTGLVSLSIGDFPFMWIGVDPLRILVDTCECICLNSALSLCARSKTVDECRNRD